VCLICSIKNLENVTRYKNIDFSYLLSWVLTIARNYECDNNEVNKTFELFYQKWIEYEQSEDIEQFLLRIKQNYGLTGNKINGEYVDTNDSDLDL